MRESIDRFIPDADVRERHETIVHAPADLVFDVAENFAMERIPIVRAIFWLRARLMRSASAGPARPLRMKELTTLGWGVLARTPGRELVAGAVTQPWLGTVTFRPVAPGSFATFAEPDLVKIVWTLEAEPLGPALTYFRSQTRVLATDDGARKKFRHYWSRVSPGILLIRRLVGRGVRREAERRYRRTRGATSAPSAAYSSRGSA